MIVSMARSHVPASPKSCDSNAQMFLESHTAWSSKSHRGCHPLLWETRVPGFSNLDNSTPTSSLLKKRPRDFRVVIYLKLHVSSGFGMRLWHQLHVWCLGIFKCVLRFFISFRDVNANSTSDFNVFNLKHNTIETQSFIMVTLHMYTWHAHMLTYTHLLTHHSITQLYLHLHVLVTSVNDHNALETWSITVMLPSHITTLQAKFTDTAEPCKTLTTHVFKDMQHHE